MRRDRIGPLVLSSLPLALLLAACAMSGKPAPTPGSGRLWVPLSGGALEAEGLPDSSLTTSAAASPDLTLGGTGGGEAVAVDGAGTLWVADTNGRIYGYRASQLTGSGPSAPAVTIDASQYGGYLYGLAFDASGDLWVAGCPSPGSELLMYTPAQLAAGGVQAAAVEIGADPGGSLDCPTGLAFDASGALWVANFFGNTVVEFSPGQLLRSGSPTPAVTLSASSGGSLSGPSGVAFDSQGNLWVANATSGTVVRFDASQLVGSTSAAPAATIASASLGGSPTGLAFDGAGALWVSDSASDDLREFVDPGALSGSATPTAAVIVSSIGNVDSPLMAFDPPPSNLPIRAP